MTDPGNVTAALILIGNELLSGRTQDTNLHTLATTLATVGIKLAEARVIADDAQTIQDTINEMRARCTYVFTTGGIGPTHDDITAENVAAAFGVPLIEHPEAKRLLLEYFAGRGVEANAARMRMARTPEGATLVDNPVSVAPGFCIGNVYVMAGVPRIMKAMLDNIVPTLQHGKITHSRSVLCNLPEGELAKPLEAIARKFPDTDIGSYPGKGGGSFRVNLIARGEKLESLDAVESAILEMVAELGGDVLPADQ
ncbi:MAG: competence/damage-inducible protein A [Gammaproteobacteria bacterium]|nr:competence/damage-inducible protein A [Gammaproteobacteria bacterium]